MRLFTGIDVPEEQKARLSELLGKLRPHASLRWSRPGNLHITTKFIGEWPETRLDELRSALAGVPARMPFSISLSGLGWFPNPHNPRIFWVAVRGGEELASLAADTERSAEAVGIAREDRAYTPHLTLARVPPAAPVGDLRRAVAALDSSDFGGWTPMEQALYLSEPRADGSVYTVLARFPFEPDTTR
ncbi:MAG: RNA 2',3'-cyclic phosphodiesterase [Bryobacteraceae bacterium]